MINEEEKLNNPVWHSLTETHREFAMAFDEVKFYHPDYCPFGSFMNISKTADGMTGYSKSCNDFYVVGLKPVFNDELELTKELVCLQMIPDKPVDISIT